MLNITFIECDTLLFAAQVMNGLKEGWFSELSSLWPGVSLSLEVNEVLHSEKSEYQDILVLQT
jgi:spermidine synthase